MKAMREDAVGVMASDTRRWRRGVKYANAIARVSISGSQGAELRRIWQQRNCTPRARIQQLGCRNDGRRIFFSNLLHWGATDLNIRPALQGVVPLVTSRDGRPDRLEVLEPQ
jgi:hypothetical protein